jgi:hypothetical protein
MMLGSVQLWHGKELEFALPEVRNFPGVFRWNLAYDPFIGTMRGMLEQMRLKKTGFQIL